MSKPPPGPPPRVNFPPQQGVGSGSVASKTSKRPAPLMVPPVANITPRRTSPRLAKENATASGYLTPTLASLAACTSRLAVNTSIGAQGEASEPSPGVLEAGDARGHLLDVATAPAEHTRKWQQCKMVRTNKKEYRLFVENTELDSRHFVLSAVREDNGTFYISHYEDFPSVPAKSRTPDQYCAVLFPVKPKVFKLYSCSCEGCDLVLGKYTCGAARRDAPPECRQHLATINHEKRKIPGTSSEAHWMRVLLPELKDDSQNGVRCVWCPRNEGVDEQGKLRRAEEDGSVIMESILPVWNSARGSLSMKFAEGRVKKASAKNFSLGAGEEDERRAVLQYGKCEKATFVMDIRRPMSLVQGFGISLSVANWKP